MESSKSAYQQILVLYANGEEYRETLQSRLSLREIKEILEIKYELAEDFFALNENSMDIFYVFKKRVLEETKSEHSLQTINIINNSNDEKQNISLENTSGNASKPE